MKKNNLITIALAAFALTACLQANKEESKASYTPAFEIQDCDMTLGGVHFSKMINGADKQVSEKDGIVRFVAPEGTDLFIDPNGGKLTQTSAKVLFTEVDNTKPFTFSVRIKPGFTQDGLYHQGNSRCCCPST